jgi:hypothetical protein
VFGKADKIKPGAYTLLDKKALQLIGEPSSPDAPQDSRFTERSSRKETPTSISPIARSR